MWLQLPQVEDLQKLFHLGWKNTYPEFIPHY